VTTNQSSQQIANELYRRIGRDVDHYGGVLPERVAIAWRGYLAAMIEWGLIDVGAHDRALTLLPAIEPDPVVDILRGRQ